ncbi:hypothetical protein [Marinovum sp.]|uniref:hypothetical protein n=1 Tax=Marinovum sp. TaxID=2024839 RepID=UPI002B27B01E|nr:hypothetical protein [Marinovum sp.]
MPALTRRFFLMALPATGLSACAVPGTYGPTLATRDDEQALTRALRDLGPEVDAEEADRAARLAFSESWRLAQLYEIEDAPLVHNSKVNMGIKARGLCYHWADDLEKRLKQEQFRSLQLHRAVANWDNILLEHSTVILSQRGQSLYDGIVLDPWRGGGRLFWAPTLEDLRYSWTPREEVFRVRRERRAARG